MIRRLFSLVILVAIVLACLYFWRGQGSPSLARFTQTKLGEGLSGVGHDMQNVKLQAAVKTALELNRSLKPFSIDVDVADSRGIVLQGEIASDELKAAAERVATAVPDVEHVENKLVVNPALLPPAAGRTMGEVLDDRALEVQMHLAFSLNRHLKGTNLAVHAHRREVVVDGEIEHEEQRPIALEIVRNVPGVGGVVDKIAVRGRVEPAA
jgi:osmotically-inducible protein OsmY